MSPRPIAFEAVQANCLDPETFTTEDLELWLTLEEHVRHGGEVLDLSAHGQALDRVPDELMEAFADACRLCQRRAKALYLPAMLTALPSWVAAFPWIERITAPGLGRAPATPDA